MKKGPKRFCGPEHLHDDVGLALRKLHTLLSVEVSEHEHHSVIRVLGLDQREAVVKSVAVYFVGAIASCIEFNLQIRAALFGEQTVTRELHRDVVDVIGNKNDLDEDKKTYERNPWLWEAMSHLLLHLSLNSKAYHPPDCLVAKNSIHLSVKDHGLDLIALYGTEKIGVTAGECKAYLERPAVAIKDAADRLGEVDRELRDAEIRSTLSQFRPSLSPDQQAKLVGAFWHDERAYFPMICCDSRKAVNWAKNRKVLKRLKPPANRKYLVPVAIEDAGLFFDAVSEAMREYASWGVVGARNV